MVFEYISPKIMDRPQAGRWFGANLFTIIITITIIIIVIIFVMIMIIIIIMASEYFNDRSSLRIFFVLRNY